jgi:hypothetical protein
MRTGNSRHPIDEDLSMGTPAGTKGPRERGTEKLGKSVQIGIRDQGLGSRKTADE